MKLVPLEIGRLDSSLAFISGEDAPITLPIPSWLIEHPRGLVLFDTGMHPELQHDTTRLGRTAALFSPDFHAGEELAARLAARGIAPSDIDRIVFSHLHFDHAGGTAEIPDARIVIQRAEWEAAHDRALIEIDVYNPDDYDLGHELERVDGVHDVFGDGRIVCLPTPGHTAGHQALRVELESGPVVLTGDCVYFERMLDEMRVPRIGHDAEQQLESMRELRRWREEGCRLLFGHDAEQLRALPEAGLA